MMCALPPDVLELVLLHVAYSLEVDGVRGPTIVVRDVLSASSTCTALRRSMTPALAWIAHKYHTPFDWDRVTSAPMTFKLRELREIAKDVGVRVSGTKSVVAFNILSIFGAKTRKRKRCSLDAPADHCVHGERDNDDSTHNEDDTDGASVRVDTDDALRRVITSDRLVSNVPSMYPSSLLRLLHVEQTTRKYMPSREVVDMYDFVSSHKWLPRTSVYMSASMYRSVVYRSFASTAHIQSAVDAIRAMRSYTCVCGNKAAVHCTNVSCFNCCSDDACARHTNGLRSHQKKKKRQQLQMPS